MLFNQKRYIEAVSLARSMTESFPYYGFGWKVLGVAFKQMGRNADALAPMQKAAALLPDDAGAHNNLGIVLKDLGQLDDAVASYRRALEIKPDFVEAHSNLGTSLRDLGQLDGAVASYRRALEIKPGFAMAHKNLGILFQRLGQLAAAIESFYQALALKPDDADAHSSLIFTLDLSEANQALLQAERRRWDQAHAAHLIERRAHDNSTDPVRRLRIGYVSADLKRHSAPMVFGALLFQFDSSRFEVFAYSNSAVEDSYTERFKQSVSRWRNIVGQSDEAVAELIRQDGIDILVDLSGHSAGNRLLVFARKPAPIQITAWGYALSTGMGAMDVFFADPVLVPPEEKPFYTEEVRYLPCAVGAFFLDEFPEVNALPALSGKGITFGSFNRLTKISEQAYALWVQVLLATPNSQLLLKSADFDVPATRHRVAERFSQAGIAPERIIMQGGTSWHDHMAAFNRIDITLDPFPHGGGVTTLEGIMMGVPVVTLRWPTTAGRVSASILTALGLTGWVAETPEQYVEIAIQKAQDLPALAELRKDSIF